MVAAQFMKAMHCLYWKAARSFGTRTSRLSETRQMQSQRKRRENETICIFSFRSCGSRLTWKYNELLNKLAFRMDRKRLFREQGTLHGSLVHEKGHPKCIALFTTRPMLMSSGTNQPGPKGLSLRFISSLTISNSAAAPLEIELFSRPRWRRYGSKQQSTIKTTPSIQNES